MSKCAYCDFASYPREINKAESYFAALYREIKARSQGVENVFDTVYFGGGTPSFVEAKYITGALKQLKSCYKISENAEITIEINPKTLSKEKLAIYKKAGINRFSVGMQSASDVILRRIGRAHSVADFKNTMLLFEGSDNVSVDIMIGLEDQTKEDVDSAVKLASAYPCVKHVSMYALKAEEGTPMYTTYLNGLLPSEDETAELYDFGVARLRESGYNRYEVSNFCKDGYYSRHNMNYWTRGEYIGFGVAAASFFKGRRFSNTENIDEYINAIILKRFPEIFSEEIEGEDIKDEFIMLALRTIRGIVLSEYKKTFNVDFTTDKAAALKKTERFLQITDSRVRIKDEYLFVQNQIIVEFLH